MSHPGRNDPCPCGSGQKYKKCCLSKQDAEAASRRAQAAVRESAFEQVIDFAWGPEFEGDHGIGHAMFWGDRLDGLSDDDYEELVEDPDSIAKYNTWFLFDLDLEDDRRAVDLFLTDGAASLTREQRAFLERMRRSHLRLYEVEAVQPEQGVTLLDLWDGTRLFVHEKLGTSQFVQWDLIGARVVPDADGRLVFEGGLYLYPSDSRRVLLKDLKRHHKAFAKIFPGADDAAFFRRHGLIFNHWWLDLVVLPPMPTLVTAEGDEIIFARAVFDVVDEAAIRAAVERRDDVSIQEDGSFVWHEETAEHRRTLGTFSFERGRLMLDVTSKARAARGRAWIEQVAAGALKYRATSYQTMQQALAEHRTQPPDPEIPADVEAAIHREFYDRHYREWLDTPVPALRNKTPRQAARLKSLRPLLVDLLKDFDNHAERDRRRGKPVYDPGALWSALGLTRPGETPVLPQP